MLRIDAATLSNPQYYGLSCVVCGHAFAATENPTRVGLLGDDRHPVFACPVPCANPQPELVVQRTYINGLPAPDDPQQQRTERTTR